MTSFSTLKQASDSSMPAPEIMLMPASTPGAGLGIHKFGIGCDQVAVSRQAEMLADFGARHVEHGGFHGAHGRASSTHVEDGRSAAPDYGRTGPRELMQRDARQRFGSM